MNRPKFSRNAKPLVSSGKSSNILEKKKPRVNDHQKMTSSYSEILGCDNSLIMNFDIEKIEEESSE